MTQDESGVEQEKQYGDSAGSVPPDTQFSDPTEGAAPKEPADREDATYAAGTADTPDPKESKPEDEEEDDAPDPQGTSAETVSDGPDKETGFYG